MPAVNTSDRRLLMCAGVVLVLLMAAIGFIGAGDESSPVPSVYSSDSGGARAAYLLLLKLHYNVRIWDQPPAQLESLPSGSLLILAEPASEEPGTPERKALRAFANRGGRVLFCGAAIPAFFSHTRVEPSPVVRPWKDFPANLPSALTRNADPITMRPDTYWGQPSSSQLPVYGDLDEPVVVSWKIGEGEVLWWASATPLTNAGITKTGNLNLFLNSVAGASAIYWDEYFHGERPSLASFMEKTPLLWAAIQIGIMAVALLFTFSRRSGPIVTPAGVSRLSPLEFVDTMGALYQHAKATSVPVDIAYRHVRLELSRRLALPADTTDPELARIAGERLGIDRAALAKALGQSAEARYYHDGQLKTRNALAIVRSLEEFLVPTKTNYRETH